MRAAKTRVKELMVGWRSMLHALHPREISDKERDRVSLATVMFHAEARTIVDMLLEEVVAAYRSEDELDSRLTKTQRELTDTRRLLADARAKNKKLRER